MRGAYINMENGCIFCKIVSGELDSAKIWGNNDFLAVLSIQPVVKGMTIVIPKKHFDSYVFEMPENMYNEFFSAGQKTAKLLKKALGIKRIFMAVEGLDINHAHLKLYPIPEPAKPLGKILTPNAVIKSPEQLKDLAKAIRDA